MKANELMIGDWVKCDSDFEQVDYLEGNNINGHPENWYEPIPFTAEILEKNGFDVSDREVMYYYFTLEEQKEYFALKQMYDKETKEPKGFSYLVCNVLTIIDYVHQLQHALRLCGIDKEIIL